MFGNLFDDLFGKKGNICAGQFSSGDLVGNVSVNNGYKTGNGKVVTVDCSQYLTEEVKQIVTDGVINLVIKNEIGLLLDLEVEENLIDCVVISNNNGVLRASCKSMNVTQPITLTLRKPSQIEGLTVSGVGNVDAVISTKRLVINKSGTGNVNLSGTSDTLVIMNTGVGNVDAKNLAAADLKVNCSGTGKVVATASKSLDCEVSGVCTLVVHDKSPNGLTIKKCNTSGLGKLKVV